MKKLIVSILLLAAVLYAAPSALAAGDAPSGWAEAEVGKAIDVGIVPEELQNDYTAPITRAEFLKMDVLLLASLYNTSVDDFLYLYGKSYEFPADVLPVYRENVFTDTNDYYVNIAYAVGLTAGRGDGTFCPDDPVTRQEAAHLLIRTYFKYSGGIKHSAQILEFEKLEDYASIADWALNDAAYMYEWGVLTGVGGGLYDPLGHLTREQAIVAFLRYCEKAPVAKYPVSPGSVSSLWYDDLVDDIKSRDTYRLITQFDTDICTVLYGETAGDDGPVPSLWLVWKKGGRREILQYLPQNTPSENDFDITEITLNEDQTTLQFTRQYEDQTILYEVDLQTAQLTAIE